MATTKSDKSSARAKAKAKSPGAAKRKPAGPSTAKLLSGGNPQVPKGDGDAPVQSYIEAMPGWKQLIGRRLDDLITQLVPNVRKAVRWNTPFYGLQDQGWFLGFHCFDKYIKVTFFRGTSLRPEPPESSKTPEARYLHLREDEPFDEALLSDWIVQASRLPGDALF